MEEVKQDSNGADGLASSIREEQSDWWLADLVRLVNRSSLSFGITLNVSGILVSGKLVGGKEYFEGVSETVSQAFPLEGNLRELIRQLLSMPAKIYEERDGDETPGESPTESEEPRAPAFIHLKDARFWDPDRPPSSNQLGIWWRGRIQAVDGFIFGEPAWTNETD